MKDALPGLPQPADTTPLWGAPVMPSPPRWCVKVYHGNKLPDRLEGSATHKATAMARASAYVEPYRDRPSHRVCKVKGGYDVVFPDDVVRVKVRIEPVREMRWNTL